MKMIPTDKRNAEKGCHNDLKDHSTFFDLSNRIQKLVMRSHWQLGLAYPDRPMCVYLETVSF